MNEVKLFVDNSHFGGVAAPVSIVVDALNNPDSWVFMSQAQFITGVPEA